MTPYSSGSDTSHHGQCITPRNLSETKIIPSQPINPPSVNLTKAIMNLTGRPIKNIRIFIALTANGPSSATAAGHRARLCKLKNRREQLTARRSKTRIMTHTLHLPFADKCAVRQLEADEISGMDGNKTQQSLVLVVGKLIDVARHRARFGADKVVRGIGVFHNWCGVVFSKIVLLPQGLHVCDGRVLVVGTASREVFVQLGKVAVQ